MGLNRRSRHTLPGQIVQIAIPETLPIRQFLMIRARTGNLSVLNVDRSEPTAQLARQSAICATNAAFAIGWVRAIFTRFYWVRAR